MICDCVTLSQLFIRRYIYSIDACAHDDDRWSSPFNDRQLQKICRLIFKLSRVNRNCVNVRNVIQMEKLAASDDWWAHEMYKFSSKLQPTPIWDYFLWENVRKQSGREKERGVDSISDAFMQCTDSLLSISSEWIMSIILYHINHTMLLSLYVVTEQQ